MKRFAGVPTRQGRARRLERQLVRRAHQWQRASDKLHLAMWLLSEYHYFDVKQAREFADLLSLGEETELAIRDHIDALRIQLPVAEETIAHLHSLASRMHAGYAA